MKLGIFFLVFIVIFPALLCAKEKVPFYNETSETWCLIGMALTAFLWAFAALLKKLKHRKNNCNTPAETLKNIKTRLDMLDTIIDSLPIHIFIKDVTDDFKYILCNKTMRKFYGLKEKDIIGNTDKSFRSLPEFNATRNNDKLCAESIDTKAEANIQILSLNGDIHHFHTVKKTYVDNIGNSFILGAAFDITELNALLDSQKAMVECQQILLRENDFQKAVFAMQKPLCEQTKATRSVVVKFNCEKNKINILSEYGADGNNSIFQSKTEYDFTTKPNWKERIAECEICEFPNLPEEINGLGKDWLGFVESRNIKSFYAHRIMVGETLWGYIAWFYENSAHKMNEMENKFANSFAHYMELTLVKTQEWQKLVTAMELAKKADIAKSFFIASISHEIRTPLNAVIGFAELLRDSKVSESEQKEYIDSIAYGANALLMLVNDVLDLSKLEANQMEIIKEDCDFRELCESVMKVFAHKATENGVEMRIEMPKLPIIQLDKLRIRQILFNFIGNAVKFTPKGRITLGAEFTPYENNESEGKLIFSVKDTGIGIPEKDIDRLLEPFVQLSKLRGTNASNNGTGLGLPICKRLAERMNGKIIIKSSENVGSEFSVEMEHVGISKAALVDEKIDSQCDLKNYENLSILLVDDVMLNLKVMKSMCAKIGVKDISIAQSAKEALEIMRKKTFDIILTDMWMPETNGAELAHKIHEKDEWKNIPIIAVTADEEAMNNFDMSEISDVLLKPFTREKVYKVLSFAKSKS